jgi:type VI secretion system protein ImpG
MSNHFLNWYNNELAALRKRASKFAERHPKIAGRLRMTAEATDDPHVDRIMQGFAYSAARIRQKLEDDFPELTDTLLEALYPQYLAQVPSMSIMKLQPNPDIDEVTVFPAGLGVETEAIKGDRCRYQTTQSVQLSPIAIQAINLEKPPFHAPPAPHLNARGCLSVAIKLLNSSHGLNDLKLDELTFYIKAPFATATRLYEMVLNQSVGIAIGQHADDEKAVFLPLKNLKPVGFEPDEAALPFPKRSFPGFRLLTEFFAMPEKFLFFKLTGLRSALSKISGNEFHVFFYLASSVDRLLKSVDVNSLELHCAPVINLFAQRAEPIQIDQTAHEYQLVPDARQNSTREIYSVLDVSVSDKSGNMQKVHPFFGRKPSSTENHASMFWQHKRELDDSVKAFSSKLCFVDLALNATMPDMHSVVSASTLCINRGLPEMLPFGGGQPYLKIEVKNDAIRGVTMLLPPTATERFDREDGSYWRLISHLSLNHLPLTGNDPELLRDMLRLYDFRQAQETRVLIDAIQQVSGKRSTARIKDGSIINGVDVTVVFDDATVDAGLAYLFGQILSNFLGLYASINTFSRLTIKLSGLALPIAKFEPRTADEILL